MFLSNPNPGTRADMNLENEIDLSKKSFVDRSLGQINGNQEFLRLSTLLNLKNNFCPVTI
jgi:hypothetical protein